MQEYSNKPWVGVCSMKTMKCVWGQLEGMTGRKRTLIREEHREGSGAKHIDEGWVCFPTFFMLHSISSPLFFFLCWILLTNLGSVFPFHIFAQSSAYS